MARTWSERRGIDHHGLGEGAVTVLAEDPEPNTEAVLTSEAETAAPTRQSGVEDYLGTLFDAFDPFADTVNDARAVSSADVRKADRYSGNAVKNEEVEMIECGAFQPHPNLARAWFGLGAITEEELVSSTVLFEVESFHTNLL